MKKSIKNFALIFSIFGILLSGFSFGNKVHASVGIPVSVFNITAYSDGTGSNPYSKNTIGTIKQDYFPLLIATFQRNQGTINEVKVDGKDISEVYSESDFYKIGENKPVFFVAEVTPGEINYSDGSTVTWTSTLAVSTLSKGRHTIEVFCEGDLCGGVNSCNINSYNKLSDIITIDVE